MRRIAVFIDGFNVYHALDEREEWHKYKWLDFSKLVHLFASRNDVFEGIYYFTALATWMPDKMARHRILIRALELKGVNVVYGEFKKRDRFCVNCKTWYKSHEEKQTDVNIAIHLFRLAVEDRYDTALIMSGDGDLIPAIKAFRASFPAKQVGVLIPFARNADELKLNCDFHRKVKRMHLEQSLFPDEIDLGDGQKLVRPVNWT
jgi:uncharacterized LabA/DUF88 family protein